MKQAYRRSPEFTAKRSAEVADMIALHEGGLSVQQIAERYSVTKQAISSRLIRADAPLAISRAKRFRRATTQLAAERADAREKHALAKWGCTYSQYLSLRCKPMRCFQAQRGNAGRRGIGWELNLFQWWTIWQKSGHWTDRGPGQGYVMCRQGDEGPYAIGNVFIAPGIINCSETKRKIADLPIGVSTKSGLTFRATRCIKGKRHKLGLHSTSHQAHAAYLSLGPIGRE